MQSRVQQAPQHFRAAVRHWLSEFTGGGGWMSPRPVSGDPEPGAGYLGVKG